MPAAILAGMSKLHPILPSVRTSGPYQASAGQTDFAGTFPLQRSGDVSVYLERGTVAPVKLDENADYAVLGVGGAGFTIRLSQSALAVDKITLVGVAEIDRVTSVALNGFLSAPQLDRELDRNRMIDQELRRDIDRMKTDGLERVVSEVQAAKTEALAASAALVSATSTHATLTAGAADAIMISHTPPKLSMVATVRGVFTALYNNTSGMATLTVDGLGPYTLCRNGGGALVPGDIRAGCEVEWQFNGSKIIVLNPASRLLPPLAGSTVNEIALAGDNAPWAVGEELSWASQGPNNISAVMISRGAQVALPLKRVSGDSLLIGDTGPAGYICQGVCNGSDVLLLNPFMVFEQSNRTYKWSGQGADIYSAGTVTLGNGGWFNVSGSTDISAIIVSDHVEGREFELRFSSALTLINSASLATPYGFNIKVSPGSAARFRCDPGNVVKMIDRPSIISVAPVVTTSGNNIDLTGIPAGVKKISILFNGVSTAANSLQIIQLGTSGGFVTSGYSGGASWYGAGVAPATTGYTSGIIASGALVASELRFGVIELLHLGGGVWIAKGDIAVASGWMGTTAGGVTIAGVVDRVRLTTPAGNIAFDAGSVALALGF